MSTWWSQLPSPQKAGLLALLLLGSAIVGFLLLYLSTSNRVRIPTPTGDKINFVVSSKLPAYPIKSGSLNQQVIESILRILEYGTAWTNFYNPRTREPVTPKTIEFVFADMSTLEVAEQQELFDVVLRDNQLVKGANTSYDASSNTLTYTTFFNLELLGANSLEEWQYTLEGSVIRGLYLSTEYNFTATDPDAFLNYAEQVHDVMGRENWRLFELKTSAQILKFANQAIALRKHLKIAPIVYAQGGACSGTYGCIIKKWTNCKCSGSGASCDAPGDTCGIGSTCQCQQDCSDTSNTQPFFCQGSQEMACIADGGSCSGDNFCSHPTVGRSCKWDGGGSQDQCSIGQKWCGSCVQQCIPDSQNCLALIDQQCSGGPGPGGGSCPAGQQVCGGCINDCRPTNTTCDEWISLECSGGGPPPACHDANCGVMCEGNPGICGSTTSCENTGNGAMCWSNECCQSVPEPLYNCGPENIKVSSPPCGYTGDWELLFPGLNNADGVEIDIVREGLQRDLWKYRFFADKIPNSGNTFKATINIGAMLADLQASPHFQNSGLKPEGSFRVEVGIFRDGDGGGWRRNRCSDQFYISPTLDLSPPVCSREGGSFHWKAAENVSNYILRVNYDDSIDGGWRPGSNYPPNGTDSRWDHFLLTPLNLGSCIGGNCIVDLNNTTLWGGKEWMPGRYESYSVQIIDPYTEITDPYDPAIRRCETTYPVFSCGQKKTCSVTTAKSTYQKGELITASVKANIEPGLSQARSTNIYLAKSDGSRIVPQPKSAVSEIRDDYGSYYYQFSGCILGSSGTCSNTNSINDLDVGTYNFFCEMPGDLDQCSGNPKCDPSLGGDPKLCPEWLSCGNNDSTTVTVACTPNCANQCGQDDGCGGTCSNADSGEPTLNINITSPSANPGQPTNYNMTGDANQQLTITWTETSQTQGLSDNYDIRIINREYFNGLSGNNQQKIASANCSDPKVLCLNQGGQTQQNIQYNPNTNNYNYLTNSPYNYTLNGPASGVSIGSNFVVAVKGRNNTCSLQEGDWAFRFVNLKGDINTQVWVLTDATGQCNLINSTEADLSGGNHTYKAILSPHVEQQTISDSSSFTFENLRYVGSTYPNKYQLQLELDDSTSNLENVYGCAQCMGVSHNICTIPDDFNAPYDTTSPYTDRAYFYLVNYNLSNGPWFQWFDGVAFGGQGIDSDISNACDSPNCLPFVAARSGLPANRAGIPITGASSINSGDGQPSQRNSNVDQNQAGEYAVSQDFSRVQRRNYDYYSRVFDVREIDSLPATISNYLTTFEKADSLSYAGAEIFQATGDLTINASSANGRWNISSGTKHVIMVDGNLTIVGQPNQRIITVDPGGFLAFIVNGTITFENSVGHTVSEANPPEDISDIEDANVEGVFVADSIVVAGDGNDSTTDRKFIGAGSFTGWDSIQLTRSFGNNANPNQPDYGYRFHNNSPTELFFYRPDFVVNAPRALQETNLTWQQVN